MPVARGGEQPSARDFADGYAEMKHSAGDMLGGVNFSVYSEDPLGGWNANIVERTETKMIEPGAKGRPAGQCEPRAASAAVEVQNQLGTPAENVHGMGRQDSGDVGGPR